MASNSKLCSLLEHKYVVHLTDEAYMYLLRYLQSEDNSALCRVLSTHLQVINSCTSSMPFKYIIIIY